MKRAILLAAALLCLTAPAATHAQGDPTYRTLRLEVLEEVIDRGQSANLVGQLLSPQLPCVAGKDVTIFFDAADDVLMDETVATLETDEGGSFFLTHAPATGGEYRAVIEEGDDCTAAESNYTAIKLRADITLAAVPRSVAKGEPVRLSILVDPFCELLDELGAPVAELRIEKLTRTSGWVALKRSPKRDFPECRFRLTVRPRRTTVYRAVGEGSFTALPRYENYFVGDISLPVLVEVSETP